MSQQTQTEPKQEQDELPSITVQEVVEGIPVQTATPTQNKVERIKKHQTCMVCFKLLEKPLICDSCTKVCYCGKECQLKDWQTHKPFCRPKDFGTFDTKKYNKIDIFSDEHENSLLAKVAIEPFELLLSDEPVFFVTVHDWSKMSSESREDFMGKWKTKFVGVPNDLNNITPESDSIEHMSRLAAWVAIEGGLKLKWNRARNQRSEAHPRVLISQFELERLNKSNPLMLPRDFYVLKENIVPSLTRVYSRVCFNLLGEGLFKNAWRLSYSCSPNCIAYISGGELKLISVAAIAPGDKLTIPFHPSITLKPLAQRKEFLFRRLGVENCHCGRCIAETTGQIDSDTEYEEEWKKVTTLLQVFNVKPRLSTAIDPTKNSNVAEKDAQTLAEPAKQELLCADPMVVLDTLQKLLAYVDVVNKSNMMKMAIDLNFTAYMMDYLLEVDAGRADRVEAQSNMTDLRDKLYQLTGRIPTTQSDIEKRMFALANFDRHFNEFIFFVKVDMHDLTLAIEGQIDPAKLAQVNPTHYKTLSMGHHFATIFTDILHKGYIYTEFFLAGIAREDVDKAMSYYRNKGNVSAM